jgi:CrcB protein
VKDWFEAAWRWLIWLTTNRVALLTIGGAAGTNARYWLGIWINSQPWAKSTGFMGTMIINITGSLILGLVGGLFLERMPPEHRNWFILLGTGFCGGYTTFSTFEYETFKLVQNGSWWLALVNVTVSVLGGFVAVALAYGLSARQ